MPSVYVFSLLFQAKKRKRKSELNIGEKRMIEYHTEVNYLLFDSLHSFINLYFDDYSLDYLIFLQASDEL